MEDFGHCECFADADDVIADYFSRAADETEDATVTEERNDPNQTTEAETNMQSQVEHVNHFHLVVLGQLSALTAGDETSFNSRTVKKLEKPRTKYMFRGHEICQTFFGFLHNCGDTRLRKVHGLQGRAPKRTTSEQKLKKV